MYRYRPGVYGHTKRNGKRYATIHIIENEAQTVEEACDIIAARQRAARLSRAYKPSLKRQSAGAKLRANNLKRLGKISLAGGQTSVRTVPIKKSPPPHPLKGLPMDQKRTKAMEMFAGGCWGIGHIGTRRLARAFGVTVGQMSVWLEGGYAPS
jgi:hypothetical protein